MAEPALEVAPLRAGEFEHWVALRCELWPDATPAEHEQEAAALRALGDRYLVLLARQGVAMLGFAEAALRRDYVNGCHSSPRLPVAFLEGIFVRPGCRRRGVARHLCSALAAWARQHGVQELASDALLDNAASHAMHRALGFTETQRVVFFRQEL